MGTQVFENLYALDLPTALAAAQAYARSVAAAKKAREAASAAAGAEAGAETQGGGREEDQPAIEMKVRSAGRGGVYAWCSDLDFPVRSSAAQHT